MSKNYTDPDRALGVWVGEQRGHYKRWREGKHTGSMTQERYEKLNKLGFVWNHWDAQWMMVS